MTHPLEFKASGRRNFTEATGSVKDSTGTGLVLDVYISTGNHSQISDFLLEQPCTNPEATTAKGKWPCSVKKEILRVGAMHSSRNKT